MSMWPTNNLHKPLPPKPRIMPGRPTRKRKRAAGEKGGPSSSKVKNKQTGNEDAEKVSKEGVVMTCGNCKEPGHNRRKCQRPQVELPPTVTKKRGRPRKSVAPIDAETVVQPTEVHETQAAETQSGHNSQYTDQDIQYVGGSLADETQASQVGPEHLLGEPNVVPDVVIQVGPVAADATQVSAVVAQDQIEAHPVPVQPLARRRKPSERITNRKLATNLGGPGSTQDSALSLDE